MNEVSAKLFEDKSFINVPLDTLLEKSLPEHLTLALKAYDVYSQSKFGVDTVQLMKEKNAKIVIQLFDGGELSFTLTNNIHA